MPLTLDQLAAEAMQLPASARALLVESLEAGERDEIERAWAIEAVRRRDEVHSGRVQSIPGEQVLAEVRNAVGQ